MKGRKTGSKLISLILSLVMIVTLLPATVMAAPATDSSSTSANVEKVLNYAAQMRDNNTKENGDYASGGFTWDTEGKEDSWRYFNGLMMDAFLMTGDQENITYAEQFYDANIKDDGTISDYAVGELDSVEAARGLFDLLNGQNAEKYKAAIQYVYTQLENQISYEDCRGNYQHKDSWTDWNIGLDGLYMAQPFLMECANAIADGKLTLVDAENNPVAANDIYQAVYNRMEWVATTMKDEATGLYHHGWNVENESGNGHFWSRSLGWYAMAQVDIIELMPEGTERDAMISQLTPFFDAMLNYQDSETGMWYNVTNRGADLENNKLETSGSAMMAYALMKAYNNGYVTDAKYGEAGLKAFNGVVVSKVSGDEGNYTVADIYQKSSVETSDEGYCQNEYVNDEAKGTGALIMAAILANTTADKLPESATEEPSIPPENSEQPQEPEASETVTGYLQGETRYELATDGVESGEVYLIVNGDNALMNNQSTADSQDVNLNADKSIATVSENADLCEWTFTKSGQSWRISNSGRYLQLNYWVINLSEDKTNVTVEKKDSDSGEYRIYQSSGWSKWYLRYSSGEWIASNESKTNQLYKKTGASQGEEVSFSVTPGSLALKTGSTQQFTPSVLVSNAAAESYNITWESDNPQIAGIDENGLLTAAADGTTNITATLTAANGTGMQEDLTVTIPVSVSSKSVASAVLSGNTARYTRQNEEPNFSGIVLTVTYDDNSTAEITTENGLVISGYDITEIGTTYAAISYLGVQYGTVRVTVEGNPYDGLDDATDYPTYPYDGAVRIDKTATANSQVFNNTGVAKVELDVAGISVKQGVDVILVVDVSNSMGWSLENSDGANDAQKLPTGNQETKLKNAMDAATRFADTLLGDNSGEDSDNTLSFVTFAGYDREHSASRDDQDKYIDSVMTVFSGVTDSKAAGRSFGNTTISGTPSGSSGSATYKLTITDENGHPVVSGANRGNTNYDYAFWQAQQAVKELQDNYDGIYAQSGRETYVVFMTDGAPSHYNNRNANGNSNRDYYPGSSWSTYQQGSYTTSTWTDYLLTTDNTYANTLYSMVGGNFYSIGFDLANGGFGDFSWTNSWADLEDVLAGMVTDAEIPVMTTADSDELNQFYQSLATRIKYAGTNAVVTDIIKSDYTLQTAAESGTGEDKAPLNPAPYIEVRAYDLYAKSEHATDEDGNDLTGMRKDNGEAWETVTFSADGTQAFSDKVGSGSNIMSIEPDGTVTISALYFTYTKDTDGIERFEWNIGDITDQEVALSYYVYLKDTLEGDRDEGVWETNEIAQLEYVDIDGKHAVQTFPVPAMNWGGASTTYEYYLVDKDGNPVNYAGEEVPFANRIIIAGPSTVALHLNDDLTVEARTINASEFLPEGYFLYDPYASYTVETSSGETVQGGITISEPSDAAKGEDPKDTERADQNGAQTTIVVNAEETYYTWSRVAFGVRWDKTPTYVDEALNKDQIVIDYGKAVQKDVLANDTEVIEEGYKAELTGFTSYNPNTNLKQRMSSPGSAEFTTDNGTYSLTKDGTVQFQLNRFLSEVDKVFCVVKLTNEMDENDFYYLYEELDVIPATTMYYEDNFAGAITYAGTENTKWDIYISNISDTPDYVQEDGTVGQNSPYGYDESYNSDVAYSNAAAHHIYASAGSDGGYDITYAQFTFTGTGFDLISVTEQQAAMVRAEIYQGRNTSSEVYKSQQVANVGATNELYQVPVLSCEDMPYGTYTVRVQVYKEYTNAQIPALNRGGHFVFDAVRIYDPIDVSGTALTGDSKTAQDAYMADSEAYEQHLELRDAIVSSADYDSTTEGTEGEGVLYIDATPGHATTESDAAQVADYIAVGPNNETYLQSGDESAVIGFILNTNQIPKTLQIGAKSVLGGEVMLEVSLVNPDTGDAAYMSEPFSHAAAQNYSTFVAYAEDEDDTGTEVTDLTPYFTKTENGYQTYVYIANYGNDTSQILSITDIKATFDTASGMNFSYSTDVVNTLNERLASEEAPVQPGSEAQLISAAFAEDSIRYTKQAELKIETTADVEDIVVLKESGSEQSATTQVETNEEGNKVWTLKFKPGKAGTYNYTVYGLDKEGNKTGSAEVSIETTRR